MISALARRASRRASMPLGASALVNTFNNGPSPEGRSRPQLTGPRARPASRRFTSNGGGSPGSLSASPQHQQLSSRTSFTSLREEGPEIVHLDPNTAEKLGKMLDILPDADRAHAIDCLRRCRGDEIQAVSMYIEHERAGSR